MMDTPEVIVIDTDSDIEAEEVPEEAPEFARGEETFRLTIDGPPKPLPRPRFFNKGIWNKVKNDILRIKALAKSASPVAGVMFPPGTAVSVTLVFYLARPADDFVGRKRSPGNLKPWAAANQLVAIHPDIDNLAKLVLDALNGVIFADDKQVVRLELHKLRDNHDRCTGRTMVLVSRCENAVF
jgi:hypothetical protein